VVAFCGFRAYDLRWLNSPIRLFTSSECRGREVTTLVPPRLFTFLLFSVLTLSCGCARSQDSGQQPGTSAQYFLISVNMQVPYWQTAGAGFKKAASELQVQAEVAGPNNYDPKAEQQEFRRVVKLKPAGILVSPADPELMKPEIDAAIAAGVPVMTIDADSPSSKRLSFIGTDNYEAGRMGGEFIGQALKGKGNVVFFTLPGQTNLEGRFRGYMEILAAYPHITVQSVVDIKGDPRIAFDKAKEMIDAKNDNVDAFVCLEALACKAVAEAMSGSHASGRAVIAMDTDPDTLNWIRKGRIQATIAQRPFTMGFVGLKMLDEVNHSHVGSLDQAWSKDPFAPLPSFVDTGVIWIDNQNVDAFIRSQGARTETK
jgi:ribose transport system substrate-binding protein